MSNERTPELTSPQTDMEQLRRGIQSRTFLIILIAALAFFVHLRGVTNDFVNWYDQRYVQENPLNKDVSLDGLGKLWSLGSFAGPYYPVTLTGYWAMYSVAGRNPVLYHLTSILLHTLTACLIFMIVSEIAGSKLAAVVAGVLFAVHPVQVEAVAWVSELKTLLSAPLMLLALHWYIRADRISKSGRMALLRVAAVICYAIALLASPIAIVFPLLIVLYHVCYSRRSVSKIGAMIVPYVICSVVSGLLSLNAYGIGGQETLRVGGSVARWVMIACAVFVKYLQMLIVPAGLSVIHGLPFSSANTAGIQLLSFLVCVGMVVALVFYGRQWPALGFWGGWLLISYIPVSGIFPLKTILQEHYLYMLLPGAVALCGVGLAELLRENRHLRWPAGIAVCLGVLLFSTASVDRIGTWRNSLTLWRDGLRNIANHPLPGGDTEVQSLDESTMSLRKYVMLNIAISRDRLGDAYNAEGMPEKYAEQTLHAMFEVSDLTGFAKMAAYFVEQGNLDDALKYAEHAVSVNPKSAEAYSILGRVQAQMGHFDKAEESLQIGLKLTEEGSNRASSYKLLHSLGVLYGRKDDHVTASKYFRQAVEHRPDSDDARYGLGMALYRSGNAEEAVTQWEEAVKINPEHFRSLRGIAESSVQIGDLKRSMWAYEQAINLDSGDWGLRLEAAGVAYRLGRRSLALDWAREAVEFAPQELQPHVALAKICVETGLLNEAFENCKAAFEINSASAEAHIVLGTAFAAAKNTRDALDALRRAEALIDRSPTLVGYVSLGNALRAAKRSDIAALVFQKAAKLSESEEVRKTIEGMIEEAHAEARKAPEASESTTQPGSNPAGTEKTAEKSSSISPPHGAQQ